MKADDCKTTTGEAYPPEPCSASWRFRVACVGSHIAKKYGLLCVDETHGGHDQHYGWPMRSIGLEWSWRRNTWFAGWVLRPNTVLRGDGPGKDA